MSEEIEYADILDPKRLRAKDPEKYKRLMVSRVVEYAVVAISFVLAFVLTVFIDTVAPVRYLDVMCLSFFVIIFIFGGIKISDRLLAMIYGDIMLADRKERGELYKNRPISEQKSVRPSRDLWTEFYELRFRMLFFLSVLTLLSFGFSSDGKIGPYLYLLVVFLSYALALLTYKKKDFFLNRGMSFYIPLVFGFLVLVMIFFGIGMIFLPEDVAMLLAVFPAVYVALRITQRIDGAMSKQETEEYRTRFRRKKNE